MRKVNNIECIIFALNNNAFELAKLSSILDFPFDYNGGYIGYLETLISPKRIESSN